MHKQRWHRARNQVEQPTCSCATSTTVSLSLTFPTLSPGVGSDMSCHGILYALFQFISKPLFNTKSLKFLPCPDISTLSLSPPSNIYFKANKFINMWQFLSWQPSVIRRGKHMLKAAQGLFSHFSFLLLFVILFSLPLLYPI